MFEKYDAPKEVLAKDVSEVIENCNISEGIFFGHEVFCFYSQHVIIILVGNKSWVKEHTNGY